MRRADGGNIAVIAAIGGGLISVLSALVVDLGSLALKGRDLQGAADLAAMVAAANPDVAERAAQATVVDNLGPGARVAVVPGRYTPDPARRPDARFAPGPTGVNAYRVVVSQDAPLYFGRYILGRRTVALDRRATAAVIGEPPRAAFSIGSRLASLDGGIANQVLGGLTGSKVSLKAVDYRALADADVSLLAFSEALRTDLGVRAGDYEGLLDRSVDTGRALRVLRGLAGPQSSSALSQLETAALGRPMRVGDLLAIAPGPDGRLRRPMDLSLNALDLATAMIEVGSGSRQLKLDLGANAGLAALDVDLAVGERPNNSAWLTLTDDGEPVVRTAQARLYIRLRTAQVVSGLAQLQVPIVVELAGSEARLTGIDCARDTVDLGVRPGVATATIGSIDERRLGDFTRPLAPQRATLLSVLGLVSVTGQAQVNVADAADQTATFTRAQITRAEVRTVKARGLARGLMGSLLTGVRLDVRALGLGLGLGGLVGAIGAVLSPLGPVLDAVLNPVLDALGLGLGEADVAVHGLECSRTDGRPQLVG